jgi:hypothetical protein
MRDSGRRVVLERDIPYRRIQRGLIDDGASHSFATGVEKAGVLTAIKDSIHPLAPA